MKEIRRRIDVPVWDVTVWLYVINDIRKERQERDYMFGPAPDCKYDALCSYGDCSTFALYFKTEALSMKTVAHEVFHLTHRIMDVVGANFDQDHHEQGALLNGYLMQEVVKAILPKTKREVRT